MYWLARLTSLKNPGAGLRNRCGGISRHDHRVFSLV